MKDENENATVGIRGSPSVQLIIGKLMSGNKVDVVALTTTNGLHREGKSNAMALLTE